LTDNQYSDIWPLLNGRMYQMDKEQKEEFDKIFPFEYVGGGYFRKKGVQKGVSAEMLHGKEVPEYIYGQFVECLKSKIQQVKKELE